MLGAIADLCEREERFASIVVLSAEGSTPCKAGSRAVVVADGSILGTVGGGRVEAEARQRAGEAIGTGRPAVFDFELHGLSTADGEPICGGRMRLLVDPTAAEDRAAYAAAAAAGRRRERGALVTSIQAPDELNVSTAYHTEQSISRLEAFPGADEIEAAVQAEKARLFVSEQSAGCTRLEVLVEPLLPVPVLLIVGGGHVGQAVAAQGSLVGLAPCVIDDRAEFTNADLYPLGTETRCGPIAEELAAFPVAADTYVVIVTRDHAHDADALEACLGRGAAYVGMIGSRRKVALLRQDFIQSGRANAEDLDGVYAPIGLDIGAVTVPEIAASIVAQLIAVRRTGLASRMPVE
jgi:xanthine dehydrogenase accessory factor